MAQFPLVENRKDGDADKSGHESVHNDRPRSEPAGGAALNEYQSRTPERLVEILRSQSPNPRSWQQEAADLLDRLSSRQVSDDWTPTADNINSLPEPLRRYIHHIETACDPSGDLRENFRLREENKGLRAECERLSKTGRQGSEPTDEMIRAGGGVGAPILLQHRRTTMNHTIKFTFEKETKGAVRFQEVGDDGRPAFAPKVGTLYVRKSAIPDGNIPKLIEVTFKSV